MAGRWCTRFVEELAYTNRSEFVREVLRDTTGPILTLGAQEGVSEGYADVAAGRTRPANASVSTRTEG